MNRYDVAWFASLCVIISALAFPATRTVVMDATRSHPYLMGFLKFAVLATLGELLGVRIRLGNWKRPIGLIWRVVVWGILGASLVLVFQTFSGGVNSAINAGLLPAPSGAWKGLMVAVWISVIMNVTFAPTMMAAHRIADAVIELKGAGSSCVTLDDAVRHIDWRSFFGFVVAKTIPCFWIPAHTITFLLPAEYRVLMAAFLSIALGAILAFAARAQHRPAASAASAD
jgi:hypothetical protein